MKEDFDKLLSEIDVEIAKIDLYGNDIIETSLSIVRHLQSIITGLRNELQTYTFPTQEDEIRFFKVQKPELLGRLLYFHKICRIEMQCPNGSNEVIRKHLIAELDNLTYICELLMRTSLIMMLRKTTLSTCKVQFDLFVGQQQR